MVVFDRDGNFLDAWGEDLLKDAHGLLIDKDDFVYRVERGQGVNSVNSLSRSNSQLVVMSRSHTETYCI